MSDFIPRPEYPRPQFERKRWINLNGEWEFEKDHSVSGRERGLYKSVALSQKIIVPFCMESCLSGIGDTDFCNCVWYRKNIELPDSWKTADGRVLLNFGACDYEATVYVNGRTVGSHIGGYVGFSFDITDFLVDVGNFITVEARDDLRSFNQPKGKQSLDYASRGCSYTRTTGIWQTVWLEYVPTEYIRQVTYTADTDVPSLTVQAKLSGKDGQVFTAEAFFDGRSVGKASGKALFGNCLVTIKLSELHLWEVGKGGLYDLKLTFGDDEVYSYFGMRSLSLDDSALVINGKKIFQRLVLDQGFYPDGIYTAPSEEALVADIHRGMECGFNGARLHEKIFEPRFLYHCDRLGYIVWGEHGNWGLDTTRREGWRAYISEWPEAVERDRNHPSLIGWCPFNESSSNPAGVMLMEQIANLTRRLDPTRPVIDSSGWSHVMKEGATDIMDWHDYDQNPETFRLRYIDVAEGKTTVSNPKYTTNKVVPRFISEYGGIKWVEDKSVLTDAWEYDKAPETPEEFIARFRGLAEALLFNPFIVGFCYTQLYDVEQEMNGLYTYDRKPKFDPAHFRAALSQKAALEE